MAKIKVLDLAREVGMEDEKLLLKLRRMRVKVKDKKPAMDEAVVGESAIVAACAFVKAGMVIAPRSLAAGVPAKVLRPLTEEEIAWKGSGTATYQELAVRSMKTMREVVPLEAAEPNRPRIKVSGDVVPKIALRKT